MNKKKNKFILIILAIFVLFTTGCGTEKEEKKNMLNGKHQVEIDIKDYGTIEVELDADTAPITVTNFVDLVKNGIYDGLTFHRIIDGFMMQGGESSDERVKNIKGEFSANDIENDISHVRGVISMARANDMNSASSQFFIVQSDSPHLDGQYAGFGKVTKGMDIVDKICKDAKPIDDNGMISEEAQPIIKSIKYIGKK